MRRVALLCVVLATPAAARVPLGTYDGWGAFRDARPLRCFAIAEPERRGSKDSARPFLSVTTWPGQGVRGQLHIRLRRPASTAGVTVGGKRFPMIVRGTDAWAADARSDAAIAAAMRDGEVLIVRAGGATDRYRLKGAATALDAATLGCVG